MRLQLAVRYVEQSHKILDSLDQPYILHRVNSRTGEIISLEVYLSPSDERDKAIALGIYADKVSQAISKDDVPHNDGSIVDLVARIRANPAPIPVTDSDDS